MNQLRKAKLASIHAAVIPIKHTEGLVTMHSQYLQYTRASDLTGDRAPSLISGPR